jgi:hypothetical protein
LDKEIVIPYSSLMDEPSKKNYEQKELAITIQHYHIGTIDTNAYDVNILDTRGIKIKYEIATHASGGSTIRNYETPKIRISVNDENKILFFPLTTCYAAGRSASYFRLDVQKGKYYLYVTYKEGSITYYSDTIPLYIKRTCKKQIKQLSK